MVKSPRMDDGMDVSPQGFGGGSEAASVDSRKVRRPEPPRYGSIYDKGSLQIRDPTSSSSLSGANDLFYFECLVVGLSVERPERHDREDEYSRKSGESDAVDDHEDEVCEADSGSDVARDPSREHP